MEWSLEPAWRLGRPTSKSAGKIPFVGSAFVASIETSLPWTDLKGFLVNRFAESSCEVVHEEGTHLTLVRRRPVGRRIDEAACTIDIALAGSTLTIRFRLPHKTGISSKLVGPLVAAFEGLEEAIRDREDLQVEEGVVAEGGTELRAPDGRILIPRKIELPTKADPLAVGWRILPMVILSFLSLVPLMAFGTRDPGLAFLGFGFFLGLAFLYVWLLGRRVPRTVVLLPAGLVLRYPGREEVVPYGSVLRLRSLPAQPYDFVLEIGDGSVRRRVPVGYLAAYWIDRAKSAQASHERAPEWILPRWRVAQDGMRAGRPNRSGTFEEYRARKYRPYALLDPIRSMVLVAEDVDREVLTRAVRNAWQDRGRLRDLFRFAKFEDYPEEVALIGGRLLELDASDEEALAGTFAALMRLDRVDEAEALLTTRTRDREPTAAEHAMLGRVAHDRGRIEDALYHVGRAVEKDPNRLDALRAWASIVAAESGKAQALSELDYVASRHPGAWAPWVAVGEMLAGLGDMDGAERYFKKALERGPASPAVTALSALYGQMNRLTELVDVVEKARDAGDPPTPALLNLAHACMALGMWHEAKAVVEEAAQRAEFEWLPAIYELRRSLAGKGIK